MAILATILAPTDAALGQSILKEKAIPVNLRQGLNFESGLNDGICVPILLVLIALAVEQASQASGYHLAVTYLITESAKYWLGTTNGFCSGHYHLCHSSNPRRQWLYRNILRRTIIWPSFKRAGWRVITELVWPPGFGNGGLCHHGNQRQSAP